MKIEPSINMVLTAEEMKPGQTNESILKEKGESDLDSKSMGWSSI